MHNNFIKFNGKSYPAIEIHNQGYLLCSADIQDIQYGFDECAPFKFQGNDSDIVCLKFTDINEIEKSERKCIVA